MLINELVEFCDEEYQSGECFSCTAKKQCDEDIICGENCKICLDDIHFHNHVYRDDYDCERLLDYYVCRYSYKYCSEIIYALRKVDLSKYPYFHILSLGCGGAPDLMAFDYMEYEQRISYLGIDRSPYWEKVHNFIETNYENGSAKFKRKIDVLNYFKTNTLKKYNVLIIQYLISFFYKTIGIGRLKKWFSELADNIVRYKPNNSPLLIIINDVDSRNTGRDALPMLVSEIEKIGLEISLEYRMRFKNTDYFENSEQYITKRNIFCFDDDMAEYYCMAISCESIQLILEVI